MKFFKHTKQAKYWIEQLKAKMPYINDQVKLNKHVELINTIITLVNDVEYLVEVKHSTKVIEKLILARFYSQIFPLYRTSDKLPIHQIVENIDNDIKYPAEVVRKNIVDFLIGKEIDLEIRKPHPDLNVITSEEEYNNMLSNLVEQLKEQIEWN